MSALNTLSVLPLVAAGAFPLLLHPEACQSLPWTSLTVPGKKRIPVKTVGSFLLGCVEPPPPGVRRAREARGLLVQRQDSGGEQGHRTFSIIPGSVTRVHFHPEQQLLDLPLPKCGLSSLPSAKVNLSNECDLWSAASQPCSLPLHHPAAAQLIKYVILFPLGIKKYFITCRHAEVAACSLQLFSEQQDHEETSPAPAPHSALPALQAPTGLLEAPWGAIG